jgi:hypothetical protein
MDEGNPLPSEHGLWHKGLANSWLQPWQTRASISDNVDYVSPGGRAASVAATWNMRKNLTCPIRRLLAHEHVIARILPLIQPSIQHAPSG